MLDTLQQMQHYIRTAFGDSVNYFDANDHSGIPIGGIGQGNGASPPIWALVSTPIFDAIRGRGYGVFVKLEITGEQLHFVGYAFVDDTDLAVNDVDILYDSEHTDIFAIIQDSVTLWEGFIRASGGAIRPDKSHWYLVDFQWDAEGNWSYVKEKATDKPLVVRNHKGVYEPIERVSPDDARQTVGVRIGPDGANHVEWEYLKGEADVWEDRIKSSRMPRALVWQSFTTGILMKLFYPLAATTLTKKECDNLMRSILQTTLSRSGYNRHISRALVYGPLELLGIGCKDMYIEQGISHIQRFIDKPQLRDDITGFLLQVSVEQLKLELGVDTEPFNSDYSALRSLATDCYTTHMWDFLDTYNIKLSTSTGDIPLQRQGDEMFMARVTKTQKLNKHQLMSVHKCRLYLKISRLSDVVSVCGKFIRPEVWETEISTRLNAGGYDWPRQGRPSVSDWQTWKDTLVAIFGLVFPSKRVATPLGRWYISWTQWEWFTDTDRSNIWQVQYDQGTVLQYARNRETTGCTFATSGIEHHLGTFILGSAFLPLDVELHPAHLSLQSVSLTSMHWELDGDWTIPQMPLEQFCCNQFRASTIWAFQYTYSPPSNSVILQFIEALQTDGISAVSDGSSKDGYG
jgi:hypothetical protein